MPVVLPHERFRLGAGRWLPWIVYALLGLAILGTAAFFRFSIPQTPLLDPDSWGYLHPAFSKLTGNAFQHTNGRNFVYPGFVFVALCLSGDYEALCVWQHALGLLTGVLLALAWNVLCEFFAASARMRWAARFLGLIPVADYLFSRSTLLFEHTVRPEAVFPFFLALSLWLNFCALHAAHAVRRPARERWCLALNFVVVCVAQSLKPSMGFGLIAANLPMLAWLARRGEPWRAKAAFAGGALAVVVLTLWLPERRLAREDPESMTFLPTMLFTIHAGIIHEQILDDLRDPAATAWLAGFNRQLENSLAAATGPAARPWRIIGLNADDLIYRDHLFDRFFGPGKERETAAFCMDYYWRAWRHRPGEMFGKIAAELAVVYDPPHAWNTRRFFDVADPFTRRLQRPLSHDYGVSRECAENAGIHADLLTSLYGRRFLDRLEALRGTNAVTYQFTWVGYLNHGLSKFVVPVLALAILCGGTLWARPERRLLAGAVGLCLVLNFAMYLTVAVAHTFDIVRYIDNQRVCTVFGEFAALLLPWQWMLAKARRLPPDQGVVS